MRSEEIRDIIKAKPFTPVRVALSDGRCVLIRHPGHVLVTERNVFVGLAKSQRSRPLATPASGDAFARDSLWLNVLQVVSIEPANGETRKPRPRRRKKK